MHRKQLFVNQRKSESYGKAARPTRFFELCEKDRASSSRRYLELEFHFGASVGLAFHFGPELRWLDDRSGRDYEARVPFWDWAPFWT